MKVKLMGIDADQGLAQALPTWKKAVFILTNVPYWLVFLSLSRGLLTLPLTPPSDDGGGVNIYIPHCHFGGQRMADRPVVLLYIYWLLSFGVALSSTLMHMSQIRVGSWALIVMPERWFLVCGCGCRDEEKGFHSRGKQKVWKLFDISCALSALAVFYFHCGPLNDYHLPDTESRRFDGLWEDVKWEMYIAPITFILGVILKRIDYFDSYIISHGAWHIVTGSMMLKALRLETI